MAVKYITSQDILQEEVIPQLAQLDIIGLDIETRGLSPRDSDMLTIQFGGPEDIWVVNVTKTDPTPLLEVLEQTNPLMIGHNLKFDLSFLQYNYNYTPTRAFDTMIAYGLVNNGLDNVFISLRDLLRVHLDIQMDKDIRETFKHTYGELTDEQIEYAAKDVEHLTELMRVQVGELRGDGLLDIARLEFDLIPVVVDMELTGIKLDRENWLAAKDKSMLDAANLCKQICKLVGSQTGQQTFFDVPAVNPRSSKQMLEAFIDLGFDIKNTSEGTLSRVNHPLAKTLLAYRKKYKLGSTYGDTFLTYLDDVDRIHAEFNQMGARSGRFTSAKPNLQNIPRDLIYRRCFIADDGKVLLTGDYSQIEYKLAALLSGESVIIEEYQKATADFHRLTASNILGVPLLEVDKDQRFIGKTVNFETIFGISKYGLAKNLNITLNEADKYLRDFRKIYPKLMGYMDSQSRLSIQQGFTTTVSGRRRYYKPPKMNSATYKKDVAKIMREGGNARIQGTAADILKSALVKLHSGAKQYDAHIVNTIHDEAVIECPLEHVPPMVGVFHGAMEMAAQEIMGDDLEWNISLNIGRTWGK